MTQEKPTNIKIQLSKFPLYTNEVPTFRKLPNQKFVQYGQNNDYPDYLAYLYNSSGVHNAIVNGKGKYIYGKGWQIKKDAALTSEQRKRLEQLIDSINNYQSLGELTKQQILDRLIYGAYAWRITWGINKQIKSIKMQPIQTIRTDINRKTFYISDRWTREQAIGVRWKPLANGLPEHVLELPAFNPTNPKGEQILYICDYRPQQKVYSLPEYMGCISSIETDVEIPQFHLNNIKTGFAAGTMITFFSGQTEDEEQMRLTDLAVKKKMAGSANAGEMLINFQNPGTEPPKVENLTNNDLDKRFEQNAKDTIERIFIGHTVTSPMLMGVKTPGELGGRSELAVSWEHFLNTYVKPRQQEVEEDVNYMFSFMGFKDCLELTVLDPIGLDLSTEQIFSVLKTEEKRDLVLGKLGIQPAKESKDNLLTVITSVSPLIANEILRSVTVNEIRGILGLPPVPEGDVSATQIDIKNQLGQIAAPETNLKRMVSKFTSDVLIGRFNQIGESIENFEIIHQFDDKTGVYSFAESTNDKLIALLEGKNDISVSEIAKKLNISESEVYRRLDQLKANNAINVKYVQKDGEIVVRKELINPEDREIYTKWRYAGPKDESNRDFCAELLRLNKVYDRSEIDRLNNDMVDFNTDVWTYKGGWYHDPVRDVNLPQCRHSWQQVIVKRR